MIPQKTMTAQDLYTKYLDIVTACERWGTAYVRQGFESELRSIKAAGDDKLTWVSTDPRAQDAAPVGHITNGDLV